MIQWLWNWIPSGVDFGHVPASTPVGKLNMSLRPLQYQSSENYLDPPTGVQPVAHGCVQPGMVRNVAQHTIVKLLKTFFICSSVFISVCIFNVWPKTTLLPAWPRDAKRFAPPARSSLVPLDSIIDAIAPKVSARTYINVCTGDFRMKGNRRGLLIRCYRSLTYRKFLVRF